MNNLSSLLNLIDATLQRSLNNLIKNNLWKLLNHLTILREILFNDIFFSRFFAPNWLDWVTQLFFASNWLDFICSVNRLPPLCRPLWWRDSLEETEQLRVGPYKLHTRASSIAFVHYRSLYLLWLGR